MEYFCKGWEAAGLGMGGGGPDNIALPWNAVGYLTRKLIV